MSFDNVWERVKEETDIVNFSQLADVVGVKQPSVSKAKKKGKFPSNWIFTIAKRYKISADWLYFGAKSSTGCIPDYVILEDITNWLSELVKNDPSYSSWFKIEFPHRFPEFRDWYVKNNSREVNISHGE